MFRITTKLNKTIKDASDSIRFLSKSKKRNIYYATAGVTSVAAAGAYFTTQTIFIDSAVNQLCIYKNNFPVPVRSQLRKLLADVIADVDPKLKNDTKLDIFNFVGSEMYCLGTTKLPSSARIGVPFYMDLTDKRQLKASDVRLLLRYKTKRTTTSDVMQQLFDSLILSDNAKRYAIAHQLNLASSSAIFVKTFNIGLCTLGSFLLSHKINSKFPKQKLPLRLGTFFVSFSLVAVLMCAFIDQILDEIYDFKAMKKTISINEQYRTGAIEFYDKLIQKNINTFELLGEYGSMFYTKDGQAQKLFGLWSQSYDGHLVMAKNYK